MSKRKRRKHGYRTPYRPTSRTFSKSTINTSSKNVQPRLSVIKTGPLDQEFFEETLQNARIFTKENNNIILDYYVIIVGENEKGEERRAVPFGKRALSYNQSDDETFDDIEEYLNRTLSSMQNFEPRFMQIVFILDREKKTNLFQSKQIRSEKQKAGRAAAKHEREMQAKEKRESDIRKTRFRNAKLRAQGKLPPAKKRKRKLI